MAPKRGGLAYFRDFVTFLSTIRPLSVQLPLLFAHTVILQCLYIVMHLLTQQQQMVSAFICYVSPSPCTVLLLWCFLLT